MPLDPYGTPPSVPAENIVGPIQSGQIEDLDAAKLTGTVDKDRLPNDIPGDKITDLNADKLTGEIDVNRLPDDIPGEKILSLDADKLTGTIEADRLPNDIPGSKIANLDAEKLTGEIDPDRIASVHADAVTGALPPEVVNESLKDFNWENANIEIPASAFVPSVSVQNSAASVAYGTTADPFVLLGGSAVSVPASKAVLISVFVNVRRVTGTFDLFLVENGARHRDIVNDVHGNDLDPVTGFGGFYMENTAGDPHPIVYGIGIKCYGDGAEAVVDSYSIKVEWFGK
jgi:hypothetical protein